VDILTEVQTMKISKESKKQFRTMLTEANKAQSKIESEIEKLEQEIEALIKSRLESIREDYNTKLAEIRDLVQTDVIDELKSKDRLTSRDEDQLEEWTIYQDEDLADLEEIEIYLSIDYYAEIADKNTLPL
jgi:Spy/CpxP family protein refolding chaperone